MENIAKDIVAEIMSSINSTISQYFVYYLVFKFVSLIIFCLVVRNCVWIGTKMAIRDIINEYEFIHDATIDKDNT